GFWFFAGHEREGLGWMERALVADRATPSPARAEALFFAGLLANEVGEPRAMLFAEQALALARELGDAFREARALEGVGIQAGDRGDWEAAEAAFTAARRLLDAAAHPWDLSVLEYDLGVVAVGRG